MKYDRSKIMRRGHEIARCLTGDRDYSEKLSKGLRRAWAEAKVDVEIHSEAQETAAETAQDEPEEVEFYHLMRFWGEGLAAVTTNEAIGQLQRVPGVSAEYRDGEWILSAEWRGEAIITRREDTLEDALDTAAETVAPAATRSALLEKAADEIGELRVRGRIQHIRNGTSPGGGGRQYWFFLEDDGTIYHIAFEHSFTDALDDLPVEVRRKGKLEVRTAEAGLMEGPQGAVEAGDMVGDLGIAAEMLTTPEVEENEERDEDQQDDPPFDPRQRSRAAATPNDVPNVPDAASPIDDPLGTPEGVPDVSGMPDL